MTDGDASRAEGSWPSVDATWSAARAVCDFGVTGKGGGLVKTTFRF